MVPADSSVLRPGDEVLEKSSAMSGDTGGGQELSVPGIGHAA